MLHSPKKGRKTKKPNHKVVRSDSPSHELSRGPQAAQRALHSGLRKEKKPKQKKYVKNAKDILKKVGRADQDHLIRNYLEALDSPRALTVWLLYAAGEHRQLVQLAIDPMWYTVPEKFRDDYAATKFLSKCVGLKTDIDLEGTAIASAEEAESRCAVTNEKLRQLAISPGVNPALGANLFAAQRLIADILGPLPASFEDVGWSRGRTTSAFGDEIASIYKYASQLDVTLSAWKSASRLVQDSPQWGAAVLNADAPVSVLPRAFNIVDGNVLITVPKNAKTDRVICYEPHMNIRLQLAVGSHIRKRLFKRGINLWDQSINRDRAMDASKTGAYATIDLSMASDTICVELVYQLLPLDWALKLDQLRSRYTLWPDGSTRLNAKFSSMGNGFTFELESLIFYALASVVTSDVSVYGDDIILPTAAFTEVSNLLEDVGFAINKSKSFATGLFRESCGMDAFSGLDCTPVYLRRLPKAKEDVIKLHNSVRSWCSRGSLPFIKYQRMLKKWRNIHTCHHGPQGFGDGHYHVDFDEECPVRASHGIDGWWFETYIRTTRVNRLYGDRVSGRFSDGFGFAAICTALGPKSARSVYDQSTDRRQWIYKKARVLANSTWPGIVWY